MASQSNNGRVSVVLGIVVIVGILLVSFVIYVFFANLGDPGFLILMPAMIFTIALLVVNFRSLARRVSVDPAQFESKFENLRQDLSDHTLGWHADAGEFQSLWEGVDRLKQLVPEDLPDQLQATVQTLADLTGRVPTTFAGDWQSLKVEVQALKTLATLVPALQTDLGKLQTALTQVTSTSLPALASRVGDLENRPSADAQKLSEFEAFRVGAAADLQGLQSRPQFDPQDLKVIEARVNQLLVQVADEAAKMGQLRKGLESIEAQMAAKVAQMAFFEQRLGDFEAAVTALQAAANTRPSRTKKGGPS